MKEFNEAQKSFLRDMLKSEGWKIYSAWVSEQVDAKRKKATKQETELNDRLWYSAEASGMEKSLTITSLI